MAAGLRTFVAAALARRRDPLLALESAAGEIAVVCRELADRFRLGGRLFAIGAGEAAADAAHISVEFIHPVIVGKPALPALALDPAQPWVGDSRVAPLWRPADAAVGVIRAGRDDPTWEALRRAREAGLLTIALCGPGGGVVAEELGLDRWVSVDASDPAVLKEAQVTIYHLLWEMVHVFNDAAAQTGNSSDGDGLTELYPFLYGGAGQPDQLLETVTGSAAAKVREIVELRDRLEVELGRPIADCAEHFAAAFAQGATLWTFGNGGSSTDARALADRFSLGGQSHGALPAHCLTSEPAVLTALTNDVGFEVVFARQLRALGRAGDIAVGLSTSGGSANVLAGFEEAKRIGMTTAGFAGYDGGAMAELASIDHLFPVGSSSVHRIQELQTTLYGVLHEATLSALANP